MNQPRSINSVNPFPSTAREYVNKNWCVVPLPRRKKEHPPVGSTGRVGKIPDDEDLTNWLADAKYSEGNIALRLGNMLEIDGERFEVIGIDVDAYSGKKGAAELARLERDLGKLPPTWTVGSRDDGVSGIRLYLVHYGYGYRGKAGDSIDIIQRVHRYAVTYPSYHPDTKAQYVWYPPGVAPDGASMVYDIPDAKSLALLSDPWIDHLTAGKQQDTSSSDGHYGIDLDVTDKELFAWADAHFNPGEQCEVIKRRVDRRIEIIESSTSNHDTLTNAHWNLLHSCAEGHSGWRDAIKEVEAVWIKDVKAKEKRDAHALAGEMKRSLNGALRKMKAKYDAWKDAYGISLFSPETCVDPATFKPPPVNVREKHWVQRIPLDFDKSPTSFDKNDIGQARHFHSRVGDNVRYLADYNGWIIYDGKHWHIDDFSLVRDLFDRAVVRTAKRALYGANGKPGLKDALQAHLDSGGTKSDAVGKPLSTKISKLDYIVDKYGNDSKIKAALNCMKSIPGVAMRYSELNTDPLILVMPNGKCIKLDDPTTKSQRKSDGYSIIDNQKEFYATMMLGVDYLPAQDIPQREIALWKNYLDKFFPDRSYRKFVQKSLGHMLIGGNPEKLAIFMVGIRDTGKSTMIHCLKGALGAYGGTFQPNSVFKDTGATNPELGNLLYKRAIFSSESGAQRIYANPFKRHSGGDEISITRKYANDQIKGIPHFSMCVATNQPPTIDDADEATVKRIMVLPFDIQVTAKDNDKRADVIIAREAKHAILHWLLEGYKLYIREKLDWENWHDKAKAATLEFASELSDVATFLSENCIAANDDMKHELYSDVLDVNSEMLKKAWSGVSVNGLYMMYQRECQEAGQTPMAPRVFGKKVRQVFGVTSVPRTVDGKTSRYYLGLKWQDEAAMNQIRN